MKKFAIFLPQFHTIPENDEWWGEGFTEWNNVRNAKSLFKGHVQPKVPLNMNYYNLLDKITVEWQTKLLHDHHMDGMIYYHYYFKGKKLLEKPAENLLKWKDIKQQFFFCWANHSWNRSWEGKRTVLMEQTYGDQHDWEEHFQYLLPFFKDNRYEKRDNMPLFEIYIDFPEKDEMVKYFNRRCVEEGFSGLYLIETFTLAGSFEESMNKMLYKSTDVTKAIHMRQPTVGLTIIYSKRRAGYIRRSINAILSRIYSHLHCRKSLVKYQGNAILNETMALMPQNTTINLIPGVIFEWDNTPRHKYRGYIISPVDKKEFMRYMDSIKDSEYVFFNAWNEWAEGMMLEPTEDKGYRYLQWIREWSEANNA